MSMGELAPGAAAPVVVDTTPPGADPVPAPDAPAGQDNAEAKAEELVKPPRTYTEEEHRKGISERLSKERRRLERVAKAEAEAAFYKRQLEERDRPAAKDTSQQKEPQPDDFENAKDYVKALVKYERAQERAQEQEQGKRQDDTQAEERQQVERAKFVRDKLINPGTAKYPDFADVVMSEDVPLTEVMIAAASRLKAGVDVLYRLAQNSAEVHRISQLPDIEQAWEIKNLEAKVTAPPQKSNAPAPIVPNNPTAASKNPYDGTDTGAHVKAWLKRPK